MDLVRAIVVSLEMLLICVIAGTVVIDPELLGKLGAKILANPDLVKYLPTIPFALSGLALKAAEKIRAPSSPEINQKLYQWSGYYRFVNRVYVTWLFAGVCGLASLAV